MIEKIEAQSPIEAHALLSEYGLLVIKWIFPQCNIKFYAEMARVIAFYCLKCTFLYEITVKRIDFGKNLD